MFDYQRVIYDMPFTSRNGALVIKKTGRWWDYNGDLLVIYWWFHGMMLMSSVRASLIKRSPWSSTSFQGGSLVFAEQRTRRSKRQQGGNGWLEWPWYIQPTEMCVNTWPFGIHFGFGGSRFPQCLGIFPSSILVLLLVWSGDRCRCRNHFVTGSFKLWHGGVAPWSR